MLVIWFWLIKVQTALFFLHSRSLFFKKVLVLCYALPNLLSTLIIDLQALLGSYGRININKPSVKDYPMIIASIVMKERICMVLIFWEVNQLPLNLVLLVIILDLMSAFCNSQELGLLLSAETIGPRVFIPRIFKQTLDASKNFKTYQLPNYKIYMYTNVLVANTRNVIDTASIHEMECIDVLFIDYLTLITKLNLQGKDLNAYESIT